MGDLGMGDWGLGIGPNPQSPIPNPQSPIPNPQSPIPIYNLINIIMNIHFEKYILSYENENKNKN